MNSVLCPHCHVHLNPIELEEAAVGACHYVICPECDAPFPLVCDPVPTQAPTCGEEEHGA